MHRKFTKVCVFVTKMAILRQIVKGKGYSKMEGGCLLSA